jgi:hypothetical protein
MFWTGVSRFGAQSAAVEAMYRFKFNPARMADGKPVAPAIRYRFIFRLVP